MIRKATKEDWSRIESMICQHADRLQQKMLPSLDDYFVLELFGIICGCVALKLQNTKKIGEIWSLVYPPAWAGGQLLAWLLVRRCERRARKEEIHQLLLINGDTWFFRLLGFRTFHKEKYALLKDMRDIQPLKVCPPNGVIIRPALPEDWPNILALIGQRTNELLQRKDLLPKWDDFSVAVSDNNLVGCCALDFYSRGFSEIRSFTVKEGYEHRGIGRALVADRLNKAIGLGVCELLAISRRKEWFGEHFGFKTERGYENALFKTLTNNNGRKWYSALLPQQAQEE